MPMSVCRKAEHSELAQCISELLANEPSLIPYEKHIQSLNNMFPKGAL
jgi:hypothetical protein